MRTLKNLIHRSAWSDVSAALAALYPDSVSDLGGYLSVFDALRALRPRRMRIRILIRDGVLLGQDGGFLRTCDPDAEDEDLPIRVPFARLWYPWKKWLGMSIEDETLQAHAGAEIVARCLWEMTFHGRDPETPVRTLEDLVEESSWSEVAAALVAAYPDAIRSLSGYLSVFETLRALRPGTTAMRIVVDQGHVCGHDGSRMGPRTSEAEEYNLNIETPWGIAMVPWEEWLGMRIDDAALEAYPRADILAHCLWEMTWHGFKQEKIQGFASDIARVVSGPPEVPSLDEPPSEETLGARGPIPAEFLSTRTGEPFSACVACETPLEEGVYYCIEKVFSNRGSAPELVYEYALCLSCSERLKELYSPESRRRLEEYIEGHVDPQARSRRFLAEAGTEVGPWIERCAVKGTLLRDEEEYQTFALCEGPSIIFMGMPFAFGAAAIREVEDLFCPETRRAVERWMREFLDLPAGWKGLGDHRSSRPTL